MNEPNINSDFLAVATKQINDINHWEKKYIYLYMDIYIWSEYIYIYIDIDMYIVYIYIYMPVEFKKVEENI